MSTNQLCPQSQHQDPEIFGTDSLQSIDGFTNLKRFVVDEPLAVS